MDHVSRSQGIRCGHRCINGAVADRTRTKYGNSALHFMVRDPFGVLLLLNVYAGFGYTGKLISMFLIPIIAGLYD